jgi:hypothetical protein
MVRTALLAAALVTLVFANAAMLSAQCAGFATTAACSVEAKPAVRVNFGTTPVAKTTRTDPRQPAGQQFRLATAAAEAKPIDCGMVQHVNPAFHSAMPIERPDPNVHLSMKMVVMPSCKD